MPKIPIGEVIDPFVICQPRSLSNPDSDAYLVCRASRVNAVLNGDAARAIGSHYSTYAEAATARDGFNEVLRRL